MTKRKEPIDVVSVEEVRKQYEEEMRDDAESLARRRLNTKQFEVTIDLLQSARLSWDDLCDMLLLGIVTNDVDFLPCKDRSRNYHVADWHLHYEKHLRRKSGELPPLPEPKTFEESFEQNRLTPSQISCPIVGRDFYTDDPLPCYEAQMVQQRSRDNNPRRNKSLPVVLDPDDPVVGCELRPCMVLARESMIGVKRGEVEREGRVLSPLRLPTRPPASG